jgi:hypothetical protein
VVEHSTYVKQRMTMGSCTYEGHDTSLNCRVLFVAPILLGAVDVCTQQPGLESRYKSFSCQSSIANIYSMLSASRR